MPGGPVGSGTSRVTGSWSDRLTHRRGPGKARDARSRSRARRLPSRPTGRTRRLARGWTVPWTDGPRPRPGRKTAGRAVPRLGTRGPGNGLLRRRPAHVVVRRGRLVRAATSSRLLRRRHSPPRAPCWQIIDQATAHPSQGSLDLSTTGSSQTRQVPEGLQDRDLTRTSPTQTAQSDTVERHRPLQEVTVAAVGAMSVEGTNQAIPAGVSLNTLVA